jgi:hypothetical protein
MLLLLVVPGTDLLIRWPFYWIFFGPGLEHGGVGGSDQPPEIQGEAQLQGNLRDYIVICWYLSVSFLFFFPTCKGIPCPGEREHEQNTEGNTEGNMEGNTEGNMGGNTEGRTELGEGTPSSEGVAKLTLTSIEREYYRALWQQVTGADGTSKEGAVVLQGGVAVSFMMGSKVDKRVLSQIWVLCDQPKTG